MPSPVVLVGHAHSCPIHGKGYVTSGSASGLVQGNKVACVDDITSCGAKITTGSPGASIHGKPIARKGDGTDHGGVLEEGDPNCVVP